MTHPRPDAGEHLAARRPLLLLGVATLTLILMIGLRADRAEALCAGTPPESGTWVNADPGTRSISRIRLLSCQPVTTCEGGTCSTAHDAGWRMRVWAKCTPRDCNWGWSAGRSRTASGKVFGFYDQGFAKRYVYAKMSKTRPGQLWVGVRTDFVDPNRADYSSDDWFKRA